MKAVNILEQLRREPSNDILECVDLIHPTEIMHKFLFIHELTLVICCLRSPSSFSVLIICPIGYANVTAAVLVHILHIFCYYLETRILGCLSRHREHIVKELITTVITCLLDMLTRSCDSCQQICHTFCYYRVVCDPNLLNALSNAKPGAGSSPI